MPVYEYECARGHITTDLRPIGTQTIVCADCFELMKISPPAVNHDGEPMCNAWNPLANRILSPTRTTFVFADRKLKV